MSVLAAAVAVAVGLGLGALLVALAARLGYRRLLVHRRVIVNLKTGRSFAGILWVQRGPLLVLRDATTADDQGRTVAVSGEVVIERPQVEFVQVMP